MLVGSMIKPLRVLTWCCIVFIVVLSLLPGRALAKLSLSPLLEMARTLLAAPVEHFVAYAVSAAIAVAGYGPSRVAMRIIGGFCVLGGSLEYLRLFSPGRHPTIANFVGSALGALCGGLVVVVLRYRSTDLPR